MQDAITVRFFPNGQGKAQCPPNPAFPEGIEIDASFGMVNCKVALPYPAPECGHWLISCYACDLRTGITAAGRSDDPKSIKIACKNREKAQ